MQTAWTRTNPVTCSAAPRRTLREAGARQAPPPALPARPTPLAARGWWEYSASAADPPASEVQPAVPAYTMPPAYGPACAADARARAAAAASAAARKPAFDFARVAQAVAATAKQASQSLVAAPSAPAVQPAAVVAARVPAPTPVPVPVPGPARAAAEPARQATPTVVIARRSGGAGAGGLFGNLESGWLLNLFQQAPKEASSSA